MAGSSWLGAVFLALYLFPVCTRTFVSKALKQNLDPSKVDEVSSTSPPDPTRDQGARAFIPLLFLKTPMKIG